MGTLGLVLLVTACGKSGADGEAASSSSTAEPPATQPLSAAPASTRPTIRCESQPFAREVDLAEASGATLLADDALLVVGDSGTSGSYVILDTESGELRSKGKLELDSLSSDDLEGLSIMDGRIYAITSSGWMREWSQHEGGFSLAQESYPLAAHDELGLVCKSARSSNCAQNYEGLCLLKKRPEAGQCAGFAAAKATGLLICLLADEQGRLSLDPSRSIEVASPRSLSGCDFDNQGRLWFGNNVFAASAIGFIEDWQAPASAVITRVGSVGVGFAEAIALGTRGEVFRFSDTAGSPSLLSKYICR